MKRLVKICRRQHLPGHLSVTECYFDTSPSRTGRLKEERSFTAAQCQVNIQCAWRRDLHSGKLTHGRRPTHSLKPCHSKCDPQTRRVKNTYKFGRNSTRQPLPALDLLIHNLHCDRSTQVIHSHIAI